MAASVLRSVPRVPCCGRFWAQGQLGNLQPFRLFSPFPALSPVVKSTLMAPCPMSLLFILCCHRRATTTHGQTPSCTVDNTHLTTLRMRRTRPRKTFGFLEKLKH